MTVYRMEHVQKCIVRPWSWRMVMARIFGRRWSNSTPECRMGGVRFRGVTYILWQEFNEPPTGAKEE